MDKNIVEKNLFHFYDLWHEPLFKCEINCEKSFSSILCDIITWMRKLWLVKLCVLVFVLSLLSVSVFVDEYNFLCVKKPQNPPKRDIIIVIACL